jgi:glycosyltransferase involved in cell wall biosynthesis
LVRTELRLGRADRACAHAEVVARFAASRHPGCFSSPRLEQVLATVAGSVADDALSPRGPEADSRVLHVVTAAPTIGGHGRWVRRLIESDDRAHSLAVTGPTGAPVSESLARAVDRSGGQLVLLADHRADLRARARRLRQLAGGFGTVVLSTDMSDVVPSLAFGARRPGLPIVRLNHADHVFWLGLGITDVLVDFRPAGRELSRRRRGYPEPRQLLVPLPVDIPPPADRAEARSALGLGDEDFVVVTVGSPYKFEAIDGLNFWEMLVPALEALPDLTVVAVGPTRAGAGLPTALRRRLVAVGPRPDTAPYLATGDVYLNPWPIGSDGAMWEAAATGLPVVCIQTQGGALVVTEGDPAELGAAAALAGDPDQLATQLVRLHDDPAARRSAGTQGRVLVERHRSGDAAQRSAAAVWHAAAACTPMSLDELADVAGPDQTDLVLVSLNNSARLSAPGPHDPGWSEAEGADPRQMAHVAFRRGLPAARGRRVAPVLGELRRGGYRQSYGLSSAVADLVRSPRP